MSLKKCIIKKLSVVLALVILIGVTPNESYMVKASTNDGKFFEGGDLLSDTPQYAEAQYDDMLKNPEISEEACQEFYNKMFTTVSSRSASIKMKILSVPYCKQKNNHYCGPATAEQTITFFNGSAENQDTIWDDVKVKDEHGNEVTEGDKLRNYVNSKQSVNIYGLTYPSSASDMSEDIFYDLNRNVPVILWVKLTAGGNWLYSTRNGHFMNASGINTGGSLIEVTDPNIGWVDGQTFNSGKYWVTAEEAYSATVARGIGYYK